MQAFIDSFAALCTQFGGSLVKAILVLIIGNVVIKNILKLVKKAPLLTKFDGEVQTFFLSFFKIALYAILVVMIVGVLGIPMASVVTVIASAGVTVGLALQGALSNLAGGIMIMAFRPFRVGEYVTAAGESGTVKEITLFYTTLLTVDNKLITIPNGALMNATITNYSCEDVRRVDLTFCTAKSENPATVQAVILQALMENPKVLAAPDAPFARLSGGTNEAMEFTARAWCNSADYWDVYFDLTQSVTEAIAAAGIQGPAVRIVESK